MCEPTSPAAATRTSSTMPRMLFRPRSFMCRTINSRRTEGKLANRQPGIFRPMATLIARSWGAGLTVLAALGSAGCAVNPATGARQLMLISESQEIAMGRDYDQQVAASIGLYADTAWQRWIQQFGARLAASSERPNLPWTFHVVDDPVVNAFALPGGYIYVTRGILAHLNSEAELAGVVGHEIGHVTARHSVSQLSKQQLAQIGLAVGTIASPDFERFAGLASAGPGVLFLKYSRDAERQADDLGLRYMRRVNYDPREMPHVFEMLTRVSPAKDAAVELSFAKEPTADAAAAAFLSQRGFTSGYPVRTSVSGLPAVSAAFAAAAETGTLRGTALFVEHGGAVYRLLGYATEVRWPVVQPVAERALQSFARLTDPAALVVEPQRVDIVRLDRRTTIEEMARTRASPVSAATLALVNQVEP